MAVHEWLRMQDTDFCRAGIFKLVPRWDKCIILAGIVLKDNNGTSLE